ncbi:OLC1v1004752C1 [Oldenlandia corymbosa var. corymbosa]|uniref:OLC1v1004752C1 n=1 Tax=Oldenlandia corymbosa var. corymbosa TaxID=529605 RepID=A0AAV1DEB6_OLDCO|nr:OLC1v1004752C1 [Oldenlandia corymbosa var. corymbosa]
MKYLFIEQVYGVETTATQNAEDLKHMRVEKNEAEALDENEVIDISILFNPTNAFVSSSSDMQVEPMIEESKQKVTENISKNEVVVGEDASGMLQLILSSKCTDPGILTLPCSIADIINEWESPKLEFKPPPISPDCAYGHLRRPPEMGLKIDSILENLARSGVFKELVRGDYFPPHFVDSKYEFGPTLNSQTYQRQFNLNSIDGQPTDFHCLLAANVSRSSVPIVAATTTIHHCHVVPRAVQRAASSIPSTIAGSLPLFGVLHHHCWPPFVRHRRCFHHSACWVLHHHHHRRLLLLSTSHSINSGVPPSPIINRWFERCCRRLLPSVENTIINHSATAIVEHFVDHCCLPPFVCVPAESKIRCCCFKYILPSIAFLPFAGGYCLLPLVAVPIVVVLAAD